jgi:hypothetical protein
LDDISLRAGTNLSFLLFVGVVLGFGRIFAHVQLDQWRRQLSQGLVGQAHGSATLFVLIVAVLAALTGLLLGPGPIAVLLALAVARPDAAFGVSVRVVALTAILANHLWIYPEQSVLYLTAFHARRKRAFSHAQARPLAFA